MMAERGGQPGNQNAAKGRMWRDAVDRALKRRSRVDQVEELDRLADVFLDAIEAMTQGTEKRAPSVAGFVELADRLDGKSTQTIAGDADSPLVVNLVTYADDHAPE